MKIKTGKDFIFTQETTSFLKSLNKNLVFLVNENIVKLYFSQINNLINDTKALLIKVPDGEISKTRDTKAQIEDTMLENGIIKDSAIVAIGGGVTCDIAGFIAATYCRGITLINVPTTLLAMVDAAIGGKNGVNTAYGKNLIGSFYNPEHILVDISFLKTLPQKELLCGLSEIIKYALILDKNLFTELSEKDDLFTDFNFLEKVINKCIFIKKEITEQDPTEKNFRAILNFGHTIAHAIEKLENYNRSHGESLSIGIIFASYLSFKKGFLDRNDFFKIFSIFKKYCYPLIFSSNVSWIKLKDAIKFDKKSKKGDPSFVLLEEIGKIKINEISPLHNVEQSMLKESLIWLHHRFLSKA